MSTLKQYTGTSWDVVAGDAGQSAYQIAVSNGYSGTEQEWLAYIRSTEPDSSGGPPSTIPTKIGDRYIDTANKITYTANGTTSISDWIQDSYPILSTTSFTGTPLVGTIVIDPAGSYNIDYLSPTGNGSLLTNLQTSQMSDAVSVSRQQSITNKYLNENNVFFQSNEYPTRLAKIEVTDNVPDNTTRVITLPNHDCTLDKITTATTSNIVGPLISNGTSVVAVTSQNSYPYLGSASDPVFHIPTVSQMILPVIKPLTNAGNITVTQADGSTAVATVDTTNKRVGIGIAAPTQALDVVGSIKSSATVTATTSVVTASILPVTESTTALQIKNQAGNVIVMNVDTTNNRIGISNTAPVAKVHVDCGTNELAFIANCITASTKGGTRIYADSDGAGGWITFGGVPTYSVSSVTKLKSDFNGTNVRGACIVQGQNGAFRIGHVTGSPVISQDIIWSSWIGYDGIGFNTSSFVVSQPTTGLGTVSNTAGGTSVTGVLTQFLSTFKVGDTITIGGQTVAISAIASDTSMTTAAITNLNSAVAYTLVGGDRFAVKGNGNVGIGTITPAEKLDVVGNIAYTGLTTQNSITRKLSFSKVMVSGALTDVVTFTLAAGETISGVVNYSITATGTVGGVAHQYEHNGLVHFSFINNIAGGYFGNIAETEGSNAKSTGGTFTDSFTPKVGAATLQATIDASGLTTPVITFRGQIEVHRPLTITLN